MNAFHHRHHGEGPPAWGSRVVTQPRAGLDSAGPSASLGKWANGSATCIEEISWK